MIKKVTVIGAGIMGNGIVQVAAAAGYSTSFYDISDDALDRAMDIIANSLNRLEKKQKISAEEKTQILDRIQPCHEIDVAVEKADFVIEAVTENLDLKHSIFKKLDKIAPENTIFGSNTSQYSITDLAAVTKRPEKVIGTHFFNPPVMMRLIEVVRGLDTSDDTVATTKEMATRMGKEVVLCKDSQGFITSRMINLWANEAEKILEEGIATKEDIDKACRLAFNHPMGPFELSDYSGLDTRLMVVSALEGAIGDRFKPTQTLRNLVRAGRLGRKSGRGFYEYKRG